MDTWEREALKSFFGVVCQDYRIYPVSVRDNVSMGGGAGDGDIREAMVKGDAKRPGRVRLLPGSPVPFRSVGLLCQILRILVYIKGQGGH